MSDKTKKALKKGWDRLKDMLNRMTNRNRNEPIPSVIWQPYHNPKIPH